jgi:UDP-N-acetylmuramoylalanine--D-glutamate ligase
MKVTKPGSICLLSPAAASYDEFLNFEMRGNRFKELVRNSK